MAKKPKKPQAPDAMPPVFKPKLRRGKQFKAKRRRRVREERYDSDKGTALIRG